MLKRLVLSLAFLTLAASGALAQSSPNWSRGYVPSAGEINSAFAKKQDKLPYTPLSQSGGTMTGKLQAAPATINGAGLSVLPGIAPATPSNGDLWSTNVGLYGRIGGRTLALPGLDQSTGALLVPGGPTLGTYQSGKFTSQPDAIQIQGSGSTGDVSGMSVNPDAFADPNTLKGIIGRTGGTSPNFWYNPDGALGDSSPKVVYSDSLSVYGADRWQFQQSTLTPYVTGQTVSNPNGSTAVRMLNGYAASGAQTFGIGTKTFTVAAGLNFAVDFPVTVVAADDISQSMSGTIASYTGTTLTLNITSAPGSGTFSNWVVGRNGATNKASPIKVTTTAASAPGSYTLTVSDTSQVDVGAPFEYGYDANFNSITGIQRGAYVVSKTATTITMSLPVVTPSGASAGTGVASGQVVTLHGDQGVYLFQDIYAQDAAGFKYGSSAARDAYLSFDINSNIAGTASVLMLGYNTGSTLGRTYAQSFPVVVGLNHITIKIKGDTGGLDTNTWKVGYNTGVSGNVWAAIGFALASHGTATSQNIPDGVWGNSSGPGDPFFATAGSINQTYNLTDIVGAYADVSNVSFTLDKPTPYVAPITSMDYPAAKRTALSPANPTFEYYATGNGPNLKRASTYLGTDGGWRITLFNDDVSARSTPLLINSDGSVSLPNYPAGKVWIGSGGKIFTSPDGAWTTWTPIISTYSGTITQTGTVTGRYQLITANLAFVEIEVPITTNGTGNGYIAVSLPFTVNGVMTGDLYGHNDISGKSLLGVATVGGSTVRIMNPDSSYPGLDGAVLIVRGIIQVGS